MSQGLEPKQPGIEGIGEGKVLSPYYRERIEEARRGIEERKQALLARLEETDDPEEKRAIAEELANLPTVIVSMTSEPVTELKGGDA
jgi:hypothetical protein